MPHICRSLAHSPYPLGIHVQWILPSFWNQDFLSVGTCTRIKRLNGTQAVNQRILERTLEIIRSTSLMTDVESGDPKRSLIHLPKLVKIKWGLWPGTLFHQFRPFLPIMLPMEAITWQEVNRKNKEFIFLCYFNTQLTRAASGQNVKPVVITIVILIGCLGPPHFTASSVTDTENSPYRILHPAWVLPATC